MSKWVRIENGVVREIIPDEATTPNVAYWYGEDFAARCVEADDGGRERWAHADGVFSAREDTAAETESEPDTLTQTQIAIAELAEVEAAHNLENKLAIAELAETLLGGTT